MTVEAQGTDEARPEEIVVEDRRLSRPDRFIRRGTSIIMRLKAVLEIHVSPCGTRVMLQGLFGYLTRIK